MKIAIIGRSLKSTKWEPLFDILEQGADAEVWEYIAYEVDRLNKSDFNDQVFDYHILVATKPIVEDKPCIRFNISATEDEILSKMQEFADSLNGEDDGIISTVAPDDNTYAIPWDTNVCDSVRSDNPSSAEVCGNTIPCPSDDPSGVYSVPVYTGSIESVQIEINGEDVLVSYQDALQLKEMMQIMSEYGYKIKRVIVNGIQGDD